LARIARKLYGDGKRWPDIATANNLADPGRIRPGQILLIPQEFPLPIRTVVRSCGG
jgi:nucleoid-associated protein YgaU